MDYYVIARLAALALSSSLTVAGFALAIRYIVAW